MKINIQKDQKAATFWVSGSREALCRDFQDEKTPGFPEEGPNSYLHYILFSNEPILNHEPILKTDKYWNEILLLVLGLVRLC